MPAEQKVTRKLRAILSADVKGYSILMTDDEAYTVSKLKEYQQIMFGLIQHHSGRVVDSPGDNLLVEFESAVDAVQCAVDIQNKLKEQNTDVAENKRLEFRIGINIGDVIQDTDRIYGSGVNIAARIEGLAEPGGICISRNAYDHIKDKLNLGYEYLGDHEVKNIKDPVRVYKVLMDPKEAGKLVGKKPKPEKKKWIWPVILVAAIVVPSLVWHFYQISMKPDIEPASVEEMAYPLPEKPSIAVLPFVNISGDPDQEYFSNGLTDEIIITLSKIPRIFVIARESAFFYKAKKAQINKVSRELGVRYILEGSVRKSQNRLRISAQLIDGITGQSLWAESYEKTIGEIFAIQDEITLSILRALQVNLSEGEQARLIGKKTNNLDAYLKAIQAQEQFFQMNRQGSTRAKELAKESITLDPKYAFPYTILANAHMLDVWFKFSESPGESMKLAINAAEKALFLDDSDPATYSALSNLYVMQQQYDKAIMTARKAIELSPGGARSHVSMGYALLFSSKFKDAIPYFEQAIRLNPYPPGLYFRSLAAAYRFAGRYDESLITYRKALNLNPGDLFCHLGLTSLYVLMGRMEDAKLQASEVLRLYPNFSLEYYAKTLTLEDQSVVTEMIETLRKAGLN